MTAASPLGPRGDIDMGMPATPPNNVSSQLQQIVKVDGAGDPEVKVKIWKNSSTDLENNIPPEREDGGEEGEEITVNPAVVVTKIDSPSLIELDEDRFSHRFSQPQAEDNYKLPSSTSSPRCGRSSTLQSSLTSPCEIMDEGHFGAAAAASRPTRQDKMTSVAVQTVYAPVLNNSPVLDDASSSKRIMDIFDNGTIGRGLGLLHRDTMKHEEVAFVGASAAPHVHIVAEIGINHNGDIELCKKLIMLAKTAGCDSVKIQKRSPDKCVPEAQKSQMRDTPWGRMTYLDYKHRLEFSESQLEVLMQFAKEIGILFFASVWDIYSCDVMARVLSQAAQPMIAKIPSALITDLALCRYARERFSTLIISTGMSTEREIEACVDCCDPDVVMHTNSTYPCPYEDLNLRYITHLQRKFGIRKTAAGQLDKAEERHSQTDELKQARADAAEETNADVPATELDGSVPDDANTEKQQDAVHAKASTTASREIGYSGHEYGLVTTFCAVALGATWVERHITWDRNMWGSDQLSSVEPAGLLKLVKGVRDASSALSYAPAERKLFDRELEKRKTLRGC
ncbi:unnamed protein product [Amoebophrya sp. A25]|nr:unnamed protein product [Amoebophrya sp. A25]|eukprot:GSA25T00010565001.1